MTKQKKTAAVAAGSFVDQLLADILASPDREILEDETELVASTGQSAKEFAEAALRASLTGIGKKRFAEASEQLRSRRKPPQVRVAQLDGSAARTRYVRSLKDAALKLSLAARSGTHISQPDLDSAIEDLADLEARKGRSNKKKK